MPYYFEYTELTNPHVADSYRSVIRRARARLGDADRKGRAKREARRELYRAMMYHHYKARALYLSLGGYTL